MKPLGTPTYGVDTGVRNQAALVGGECSTLQPHCYHVFVVVVFIKKISKILLVYCLK